MRLTKDARRLLLGLLLILTGPGAVHQSGQSRRAPGGYCHCRRCSHLARVVGRVELPSCASGII